MKAIEIFNEFLDYCNDYEIISNNIVLKNEENQLTIFKPDLIQEGLFYEIIYVTGRESGVVGNLDDLIEIVFDIVGEEKINKIERSRYSL